MTGREITTPPWREHETTVREAPVGPARSPKRSAGKAPVQPVGYAVGQALDRSPPAPSAPTAAPTADRRGGGRRGLAHLPALDGVRGAAVIAMLTYHAGVSWAPGVVPGWLPAGRHRSGGSARRDRRVTQGQAGALAVASAAVLRGHHLLRALPEALAGLSVPHPRTHRAVRPLAVRRPDGPHNRHCGTVVPVRRAPDPNADLPHPPAKSHPPLNHDLPGCSGPGRHDRGPRPRPAQQP